MNNVNILFKSSSFNKATRGCGDTMLTLTMAKKIVSARERKALEKKSTLSLVFMDSNNFKYFERMDNTSYGSIRISQLKAKTSASLSLSTKAPAE